MTESDGDRLRAELGRLRRENEAQAAELAELRRTRRVAVDLIEARNSTEEAGGAALRESEERYRLVVESATDYAIFTMDLDRRVTGWNVGAERVLGWTGTEILGQPADVIFTPEDREAGAPEQEARGAVEAGRAEDVRWHLRRDGSRLWASGVMLPLRDGAGATRGLLKILRDKTAEKRAEDGLRRLNEVLEARVAERTAERDRMWETSPDLMLVIGFDGVFRRVNPAWMAVLGYAPEELVGHHVNEFVLPDDHRGTVDAYELAGRGGRPAIENRYRHKDGSIRWISWAAAPAGDVTYATGRDITAEKERQAELERAQEQLRQSQKMEAVGQLTGGIAHDFNNMLQGIGGAVELARRRVEQGRVPDALPLMDAARQGVTRAAALTHRLLAFARRQALDPKPVVLDELVAGMAELIGRAVGPAVEVRTRAGDGGWPVLCDANQLENVLLNLAINARDAMSGVPLGTTSGGPLGPTPDGGTLTLATHDVRLSAADVAGREGAAPGDYVELCVSDTGAGMTPEVMARAFEPFFTTKPIGQGTGLGLSQLYGFVRQSGGFVRLDSAPGRGTTVRLYLPRHRGDGAAPQAQAPGREGESGGAGKVVLLVEDEAAVRAVAAEALREQGYTVLEAEDGPAGLRLLAGRAPVDALVTDVGLPGMNGRQLAEAAREHEPGLPVLFITGYAGGALRERLAPGMEAIGKPFTLDALAAKVRAMLDAAPARPAPEAAQPET